MNALFSVEFQILHKCNHFVMLAVSIVESVSSFVYLSFEICPLASVYLSSSIGALIMPVTRETMLLWYASSCPSHNIYTVSQKTSKI